VIPELRPIWIIATNTFREIIRDRILYGIVVFALLLIGLSIALGQLSYAEQARISADFGFTGIQMSAAILAIFAGSTLVAREIEKQTVLTLLARPVSRAQFLMGKFLGLSLVVLTVVTGLAVVLIGLLLALNFTIGTSFFVALLGIALEAMVLTSLALFFGSFARPIMTVVFTVSLFMIGHWVKSLDFFVKKSESESFKVLGKFLGQVIPNLEKFNWRSAPIYSTTIPQQEILTAVGYGLGWTVFLMVVTTLIFRRRDFV
jgi:ABC-type transport system involved in multi-copper enzyme maturation permease subunit